MQIIKGSLSEIREQLNALPDTGQWVRAVICTKPDALQTPNPVVVLDTDRITDWDTFHTVFADVFGFPDFYGRSMNAWTDCLSSLDYPDDGMTKVHAPAGGVLVLQLENADAFAARCPKQYNTLIECAAFVNWRRIKNGEPAVLCLSFAKQQQVCV